MHEEDSLSFNFWPSFADMMLALVLVLCLALFLVSAAVAVGKIDLTEVQERQMTMIKAVAKDHGVEPRKLADGSYGVYVGERQTPDIVFHNDLSTQRITFSDSLLFEPDGTDLKPEGVKVLELMGDRLSDRLPSIREIQIQGHADTTNSRRFPSNVELAAARAVAVFRFLHEKAEIDPAKHLMSVTSFGQYLSVQRSADRSGYTQEKLDADNANEEQRRRNRRIELVLTYLR